MPDALISRAEASKRTGLSTVTIDRLRVAGVLPTVHYGRAVRIPEDAVADYIRNGARVDTRARAADATERRIAELVATAPPLSEAQRSRLRLLLNPPRRVGAGDAP